MSFTYSTTTLFSKIVCYLSRLSRTLKLTSLSSKNIFLFQLHRKVSKIRGGQICFWASDFSNAQIYLRPIGHAKNGGQIQSVRPIETQLKTLLLVLYYLSRTCSFHSKYVSITNVCNEAFVI